MSYDVVKLHVIASRELICAQRQFSFNYLGACCDVLQVLLCELNVLSLLSSWAFCMMMTMLVFIFYLYFGFGCGRCRTSLQIELRTANANMNMYHSS